MLEDHTRPVLSLAVAGGYLFSGSYDYTIRVWSLDTLQRVKTLTGHTDAVRTLAVAGNRLFSGSYDGTVKVRGGRLGRWWGNDWWMHGSTMSGLRRASLWAACCAMRVWLAARRRCVNTGFWQAAC